MPWLHGLKARHEQQNTADYLNKRVFLEKLDIFLEYVQKAAWKETVCGKFSPCEFP